MAPCAIIFCVHAYHVIYVQSVMCCCLDCSLSDTCVQSLDHACTTRHNIGNENGIMAKHGSLKEFNHAKGDGKSYSE